MGQMRHACVAPAARCSAEEAARAWHGQGVEVTIARPREWEVWAAPEATDPPGRSSTLVERQESERLILELRRPEGTVTLQGPIRIEAPGGLAWGEGTYSGPFLLQSDAYGSWSLVEQVPLERYLEGVVPHEIGAGAPRAALEAQAVLARTWALRKHGLVATLVVLRVGMGDVGRQGHVSMGLQQVQGFGGKFQTKERVFRASSTQHFGLKGLGEPSFHRLASCIIVTVVGDTVDKEE